MTAHAQPRRIGWFRWHWLRATAVVARWQDARDTRRQADGEPFWGDTGTIGDLSQAYSQCVCDAWGGCPQGCPKCIVCWGDDDNQTVSRALSPLPDDGWRPLGGHALHELSTWQPAAWTRDLPGPAGARVTTASESSGAVTPAAAADQLPYPLEMARAAAGPAGESDLPGTGEGDGRNQPPSVLQESLCLAAIPEWARRLLDAPDLGRAILADLDHCHALGEAA